jgi:hypothetical protein
MYVRGYLQGSIKRLRTLHFITKRPLKTQALGVSLETFTLEVENETQLHVTT